MTTAPDTLYAIEAEIRGHPAEDRLAVRRERSAPLVAGLRAWLEGQRATVSRKSALGGAIDYALARWQGLSLFLEDGRLELDNNSVERTIRPLALTRKNALFAGSDGGGEHWATVASLVETCKLNGIDPQAYLAAVLTRLAAGHPVNRLDQLLPWTLSTPEPAAVA